MLYVLYGNCSRHPVLQILYLSVKNSEHTRITAYVMVNLSFTQKLTEFNKFSCLNDVPVKMASLKRLCEKLGRPPQNMYNFKIFGNLALEVSILQYN